MSQPVLANAGSMATDSNASQKAAEPELLVRQAAAGEQEAFSQLVDYFRPRLCILLDKFLSESCSGLDAEDVVQETFVKVHQNLKRFDSSHRFSTWLYTIAYRTARDHVRRQRRWVRMLQLFSSQQLPEPWRETDLTTRDQATQTWELAQTILSAGQYSALWLRYGEGLDVAEVAEILGKSQGAVRVLLHRSRMAILEKVRLLELHSQAGRSSTGSSNGAGADN